MDGFVLSSPPASDAAPPQPYDVENDFCPPSFRPLFPPTSNTLSISDFESVRTNLSKKLTLDELKLMFNAHRLTMINDENASPSVDLESLAKQSLTKLRLNADKVRIGAGPCKVSMLVVPGSNPFYFFSCRPSVSPPLRPLTSPLLTMLRWPSARRRSWSCP